MRRRNEKKEKEKGGTPTASPTASPKPQKTRTPQSPKSSKETKEEPKRTKENEPIQEAKSSKETPLKEETKKIEKIDEQIGKKAEQIPEQLKGSTFIQQEFVQEWQILRDMFNHSSYLMLLIEFCSFIPHLLSLILVLRFFLGDHNVWVLVFFVGIVVNKAVNYILKHIFCQPRPAAAKRYGKTGYGMPSDHSQFMAFFSTYGILWIVERYETSLVYLLIFFAFLLSALVGLSRFRLQLHTFQQLVAGYLVGFIVALVWYYFDFEVGTYFAMRYPFYFTMEELFIQQAKEILDVAKRLDY